nr:MAG TPA: hypothetical protein [Bacteriophage sp.]
MSVSKPLQVSICKSLSLFKLFFLSESKCLFILKLSFL